MINKELNKKMVEAIKGVPKIRVREVSFQGEILYYTIAEVETGKFIRKTNGEAYFFACSNDAKKEAKKIREGEVGFYSLK